MLQALSPQDLLEEVNDQAAEIVSHNLRAKILKELKNPVPRWVDIMVRATVVKAIFSAAALLTESDSSWVKHSIPSCCFLACSLNQATSLSCDVSFALTAGSAAGAAAVLAGDARSVLELLPAAL